MTKYLAPCFIAVIACFVVFSGIGFAADRTQIASGFLNSHPAEAFQFGATPSSSRFAAATKKSFDPADFSLPEASLSRVQNEHLGSLLQNEAEPEVKPRSPKKKIGRIMTIAGLGVAAIGTIMVVAAPERPNDIGNSGMGINLRATGFVWIGVGLGVAIAGLILGSSK